MIRFTAPKVVWFDVESEARVGRAGDEVVIEWPNFVRLRATPAMDRAVLEALGPVDDELVRKMEGFVRAFPAYLRGAVVFHAAAVAIDDRALLVLGDSGAGKSTTAALLCAEGAALLADDTTVGLVDDQNVWLQPVETNHWLDEAARHALAKPDELAGKRPVAAAVRRAPARLTTVVVLEPGERGTVEVTPLRGLAAAAALLKSALRLPLDADRSKRDLDALARIASRVAVHHVLRPREFSSTLKQLPSVLLDLVHQS